MAIVSTFFFLAISIHRRELLFLVRTLIHVHGLIKEDGPYGPKFCEDDFLMIGDIFGFTPSYEGAFAGNMFCSESIVVLDLI